MFKVNKKGGVILKLLIVIACALLLLSVEVPRRMWQDQKVREKNARKRMVDMNDCEIVYRQENNSFDKDLKKVYDFVATNLIRVNSSDIESELLTVDSTSLRLSFSDFKHIADLNVLTDQKQPLVKAKEQGIKPYEIIHDPENGYIITLKNKDVELGLESARIFLNSSSPITATAKYKNKKEIYWDFISTAPINMIIKKVYSITQDLETENLRKYLAENEYDFATKSENGNFNFIWLTSDEYKKIDQDLNDKNLLSEDQKVNMARYILSDFSDRTPYLSPSTRDPFKVSYNLTASVGMKINFFKGDEKPKGYEEQTLESVSLNDKIKNYFLAVVRRKAERKVTDFVREYEIDGDSTYSSDEKKSELFSKFVTEWLKENGKKVSISEQEKKAINSTDLESTKDFSENMRFNKFFSMLPGEKIAKEFENQENQQLLGEYNFVYQTLINKIDTVSVKIASPIDENSTFSGIKRNLLQKESIFGIENDKNTGYIDNGRISWKKD